METVNGLQVQANISILYPELPLLERANAAAMDGFTAVECWWPFDEAVPSDAEVEEFGRRIEDAGVSLRALNFYAGDMKAGERGILSVPSRLNEFLDNVSVATSIGQRLGVGKFNALYGNRSEGIDPREQNETALVALRAAAESVSSINASVLVEAVSGVPSYPLKTATQARAVIESVGLSNIELLADLYHLFINGDDLPSVIRKHVDVIGHVQIADAPGRHEPGTGSIPVADLLALLVSLGYDGSVGLEYAPIGLTSEGIAHLADDLELSAVLALPVCETERGIR